MKKVNFDLEVEVHDDLKDEVIKEYMSRYFINKKSFDAFTLQVIGERDYRYPSIPEITQSIAIILR